MHVAACFCLVSLLKFQEEEEEDAKRGPDGHGRSFGSRPWQKKGRIYSLKIMAGVNSWLPTQNQLMHPLLLFYVFIKFILGCSTL